MLKILLVNDVFPHIDNRTTIFFRNIMPILSKKFDVKVYWLITDNYGDRCEITNSHYEILYMSNFKNALQVIQKVEPNVMYYLIGWHITDYALMLAGNFLKIPSFGYCEAAEIELFNGNDSRLKQISKYLEQFFTIKNINAKRPLDLDTAGHNANGIDRLDDLSFIYFHIKEAADLFNENLGFKFNFIIY